MVGQLPQDLVIKIDCIIEYKSSISRVDLIDGNDFWAIVLTTVQNQLYSCLR